jgi:hypothetical protein
MNQKEHSPLQRTWNDICDACIPTHASLRDRFIDTVFGFGIFRLIGYIFFGITALIASVILF